MTERPLVASGEREAGNFLAIILLLLVPLACLASSSLTLSSRQSSEQESQRRRALALFEAESGLDQGMAQLLANPLDFEPILVESDQGGSVRYLVEFAELGADGLDNDGDGVSDDPEEADMIRITASGAVNVVEFDDDGEPVAKPGAIPAVKRVRAIATRNDDLAHFPWALHLGDPLAELSVTGESLFVDGFDSKADLTPGLAAPVPGIGTTGDPAFIASQLDFDQQDDVTGQGGAPSVLIAGAIDLQALIDTYKSMADVKFVNESQTYTGDLGDPAGDYEITYVHGNLQLTGGGQGAGLLLVEGNLEVDGEWDYHGIVVATGQIVLKGIGTRRILGCVLAGGDLIADGANIDPDDGGPGAVDLRYSSEIQDKVAQSVATYTLGSWQEL